MTAPHDNEGESVPADRRERLRQGELVSSFRKRLGLTQQETADRSVGGVGRAVLANVERGANGLTGTKSFSGIARGLGLLEPELKELLSEAVTVDALAERVLARDVALARLAKSKAKKNNIVAAE